MVSIAKKAYNITLSDIILFAYFCIMYAHNAPFPRLFTLCTFAASVYFLIVLLKRDGFIIHKSHYRILAWYSVFIIYELAVSIANGIIQALMWNNVIQNVLLILVCCVYVNDKEHYHRLIKIFALSALYFGIVVLLTSPMDTWGTLNFVGITLSQRNTIAYIVGIGAAIFLYWGFYTKNKLLFICALVCAFVTILTGSRKGIIQLIIPLVLYVALQENIKKKFRTFAGVFMVLVVVAFICANSEIFMDTYGTRFLELFAESTTDDSVIARESLSALGMSLFYKNPVFGYGLGASYRLTASYGFGVINYFHNNYVEILTCGGVIGFLIYTIPFIKIGYISYKNRRGNIFAKFIFVLIIIYFVLGIGQVTVYYATFYPVFFIMLRSKDYGCLIGEIDNGDDE